MILFYLQAILSISAVLESLSLDFPNSEPFKMPDIALY